MIRTLACGCTCASVALLLLGPPAWAEKEIASLSLSNTTGTSGVDRVGISPDAKQVAVLVRSTVNDEKGDSIRLLDLKTKKEVWRLTPGWVSRGEVRGRLFTFTPDGKQLVCSGEKAVYVYEVKTRKLTRTFTTKAAKPYHAALSCDGKTLVCGDQQRVGVYELATGKELVGLEAPQAIHNVAISKDGKRVAAAHRHGKVTVWEAATRTILLKHEIKGGGGGVAEMAFSPDGKRILLAGITGPGITDSAFLCDLDKKLVAKSLSFGESRMGNFTHCGVAFTPKGDKVILAGTGKGSGIYVWEPATGKLHGRTGLPKPGEDETPYHITYANGVGISPDGKTVVTGHTKVRVFDIRAEVAPAKKP